MITNANPLTFEPILISLKKGESISTANLSNTPFINKYKGCGRGIAYVKEIESKYYLVDFNYGSSIKHKNLDYSKVDFSGTQVCFVSGKENALSIQEKQKEVIDGFAITLKTKTIFGKEFLFCDEYPSELNEFLTFKTLGFVQQGSFEKTHQGEGFGNYKELLPQNGAYQAFIYDRNKIQFTWGYGNNEENVIRIKTLRFYDSKDKCYNVLVNPNIKAIEKNLNTCFDCLSFKSLNNNVKVRFVYQYDKIN